MIAEFPLGLENLENGKAFIFQSGKSQRIFNRLENAEKKTKILEKSGKFRQMLFIIVSWYLNELCSIC